MTYPKSIAEILKSYGFVADEKFCAKIDAYISLLLLWNQKIALTTVRDPEEIIRFHFGESLFVLSRVHVENCRLADVGSGAGFPGIPLAIAIPSLSVTLIESNGKKSAFLSEVIRKISLPNVTVLRSRLEDLGPEIRDLDLVTARALGNHDRLLDWASQHLSPSGRVVLWLGEDDSEVIMHRPDWIWEPSIRIPESRRRFLLIGSPKPSG